MLSFATHRLYIHSSHLFLYVAHGTLITSQIVCPIIVSGINVTESIFDRKWSYRYEPCPIDGCPQPPDPNNQPQETKYGSNQFIF